MKNSKKLKSILCIPALKEIKSNLITENSPDAILLDLEDSVPWHEKEKARAILKQKVEQIKELNSNRCMLCRINSIKTDEGFKDLFEIYKSGIKFDLIHIPKIETLDELRMLNHFKSTYKMQFGIQIIIESAKGLIEMNRILSEFPEIDGVVFGAADFSLDVNLDILWDSLLIYRQEFVKYGRLHRVQVVDSPFFDFNDNIGLRRECDLSLKLGFTGKMAIHPCQIDTINSSFRPSDDKLQIAKRIVQEAKHSSSAIINIDGKMIGPPMIQAAMRLLDEEY